VNVNVPNGKKGPWMQSPWITTEIIRLLRRKRRCWKVVNATGTPKARERYREVEKECTNKIRIGKKKMERNLANNPDKNNHKFVSTLDPK
jgi:hypothetical protein